MNGYNFTPGLRKLLLLQFTRLGGIFMNDLKKFCVIGFFVTTVLGILSHFVYDWTGGGFLIGLFFPVNESTWEHMKLLFFPMFFSLFRFDFYCIFAANIFI